MPSTPSVVRFGILGAARVTPASLLHPAAVIGGVEIAAVAARSEDKARAFARANRIPQAYGGYQALLDDPAVDAVYVTVPTGLHAEWVCRALEAGKHVLCEKPLAANAAQAEKAVATAHARGRVLQEGMHCLYASVLREQCRLLRTGAFGRLLHVEACARFAALPLARDDFRLNFALGGGAALDLGCYAVASLRYLTGEEPKVMSVCHTADAPQIDQWMRAELTLPSGADAVVECGFKGAYAPRFGVTVTCARGTIEWVSDGLLCTLDGCVSRRSVPPVQTYRLQLEAFVRRIGGLVADAPPAEDAIGTARIIDAMYQRAGLACRGAGAP